MKKYRDYMRKGAHFMTAVVLISVTLAVGRAGLAGSQNTDYIAETTEKALLCEKIVLG